MMLKIVIIWFILVVNMRECFKFFERNQIEFCLKNKVPGTSFVEAATKLGYRKI